MIKTFLKSFFGKRAVQPDIALPSITYANFASSFERIIAIEGERYTNDPNDRGGPTKWGITLRTLSAYRHQEVTAEEVKNLSKEEAKAIYKNLYWDKLNLDQALYQSVADVLFDAGVNFGPPVAASRAQEILVNKFHRVLPVDGVIGKRTISELNLLEPKQFIYQFALATAQKYCDIVRSDPSQLRFLKGWINRSFNMLQAVL